MVKKTLSHGLKVLKISTWIGAIFALLVVLMVGFFVAFPAFLKVPIEQQLSSVSGQVVKISKIAFGLTSGKISLNINDISIAENATEQPSVSINKLYWQVHLFHLFDDIYRHSKVEVDVLTVRSGSNMTQMDDIKQILSLEVLSFFESLSIKKTLIKNGSEFEIEALQLIREPTQWRLEMPKQTFANYQFKATAALAFEQLKTPGALNIDVQLIGDDFAMSSNLNIDDNFVELDGLIGAIDVTQLSHYFPATFVGKEAHQWLSNAFIAGELQNIKLKFKQNLSEFDDRHIAVTAHLHETELLFDADWQTLKNLDADIIIEDEKITVMVNHTELYQLPLKGIQAQIPDMTTADSGVEVVGNLNAQSDTLMAFLKASPLNAEIGDVLEAFTLSGEAEADIRLFIPFSNKPLQIHVEADINNNELTALEGALVVEDYNSHATYRQGRITAKGTGKIRNTLFDIDLNPHKNTEFAVALSDEINHFKAYINKEPDHRWRADVSLPSISSRLLVDLSESMPLVELQDLHIMSQSSNTAQLDLLPSDLPNMSIKSKGVTIDKQKIPDFKVDLRSEKNVLSINNLEFEGLGVDDNNLRFNGSWLNGITTLIARAKGKKLSNFLEKMGVKEPVDGGDFDFDVRLFCQCEPWNMNTKNITGYVAMNVEQGVFTNQDPNIGRLFSLLNIRSIAKRLKFDNKDLTSAGFAYDNIKASIYLGNALAKIDNFKLNATSSTITLNGYSNIAKQEYNLLAKVTPAIRDSVPIATYLAGGGLAGLGVWILDKLLFKGKMLNTVVDGVAEFDYKITGPWKAPIIK